MDVTRRFRPLTEPRGIVSERKWTESQRGQLPLTLDWLNIAKHLPFVFVTRRIPVFEQARNRWLLVKYW
jgi:hypothetical protein